MHHRSFALLLAGFVAITLCGCIQKSNANTATPVTYTTLSAGSVSGITSERFQVIRDNATLNAVWTEHANGAWPAAAQPTVDFTTQMVIAAFLGDSADTGYGIGVSGVEEQANNLVVNITITLPSSSGSTCSYAQVITQPYHFVSVPQSNKPIAFNTTVQVSNC